MDDMMKYLEGTCLSGQCSDLQLARPLIRHSPRFNGMQHSPATFAEAVNGDVVFVVYKMENS